MSRRHALAVGLIASALALTGCGGTTDVGQNPPPATSAPTGAPASSPAASSEQPSQAPSSQKPSSQSPSAAASSNGVPTLPKGFPSHNPALKQVQTDWIKLDVPAGWTATVRPAKDKTTRSSILLVHAKTGSRVYFGTVVDMRLKGKELEASNAGLCGAYVKVRGDSWFEKGWKEGPISPVTAAKGVGFSCGIQGTLKADSALGKLDNAQVEMPISTLAIPNGNAMYQMVMLPMKGDAQQNKVAGAEAAIMLHQAASNWYGTRAW